MSERDWMRARVALYPETTGPTPAMMPPAYRCPKCGRVAPTGAVCPCAATETTRVQVLEAALRLEQYATDDVLHPHYEQHADYCGDLFTVTDALRAALAAQAEP